MAENSAQFRLKRKSGINKPLCGHLYSRAGTQTYRDIFKIDSLVPALQVVGKKRNVARQIARGRGNVFTTIKAIRDGVSKGGINRQKWNENERRVPARFHFVTVSKMCERKKKESSFEKWYLPARGRESSTRT